MKSHDRLYALSLVILGLLAAVCWFARWDAPALLVSGAFVGFGTVRLIISLRRGKEVQAYNRRVESDSQLIWDENRVMLMVVLFLIVVVFALEPRGALNLFLLGKAAGICLIIGMLSKQQWGGNPPPV